MSEERDGHFASLGETGSRGSYKPGTEPVPNPLPADTGGSKRDPSPGPRTKLEAGSMDEHPRKPWWKRYGWVLLLLVVSMLLYWASNTPSEQPTNGTVGEPEKNSGQEEVQDPSSAGVKPAPMTNAPDTSINRLALENSAKDVMRSFRNYASSVVTDFEPAFDYEGLADWENKRRRAIDSRLKDHPIFVSDSLGRDASTVEVERSPVSFPDSISRFSGRNYLAEFLVGIPRNWKRSGRGNIRAVEITMDSIQIMGELDTEALKRAVKQDGRAKVQVRAYCVMEHHGTGQNEIQFNKGDVAELRVLRSERYVRDFDLYITLEPATDSTGKAVLKPAMRIYAVKVAVD